MKLNRYMYIYVYYKKKLTINSYLLGSTESSWCQPFIAEERTPRVEITN